jgi:hypothetical protein
VPSAEQLTGALASEIGFLFLDRTRIRPAGFGIGEHVMSLSLAPGEEVTIEQKTFSKREGSYEQISDQEQTFDLELSSTLTNEVSESLDHEQSVTKRSSTGAEAGISGEASGVGLKIAHNQSDNVDDADREKRAVLSRLPEQHRRRSLRVSGSSTRSRFESRQKPALSPRQSAFSATRTRTRLSTSFTSRFCNGSSSHRSALPRASAGRRRWPIRL